MPAINVLFHARAKLASLLFLLVIVVGAATTASAQITVSPAAFPSATVGEYYPINLVGIPTQSFSVGPLIAVASNTDGCSHNYAWTLVSGTLPPGLTLLPNTSTNCIGALTGVPTTPGTFTYSLQVTDDSTPPQTASVTYTTAVSVSGVSIVPATLPGATLNISNPSNSAFNGYLAATGGLPPYSWSVVSGTLPSWLTLSPTSQGSTSDSFGTFIPPPSVLSGTPSNTNAGTYSFTVQVQDSSPTPQIAVQIFSLSVVSLQQFPDPNGPYGITTGPDGALWYVTNVQSPNVDQSGNFDFGIGSVTTSGTIRPVSYLPSINFAGTATAPQPIFITSESGALWFTEPGVGAIGQLSPSGAVTQHILAVPGGLSSAGAIQLTIDASSSTVWFTGSGTLPSFNSAGFIGRFATSSPDNISYSLITANPGSNPQGIVKGPDGAFWFADTVLDQNGNPIGAIGRITADGVISPPPGCSSPTLECPITGTGLLQYITAGPDGSIWFTDFSGKVGRITVDGSNISLYPVPTASTSPLQIIAGPDGALWVLEDNNQLLSVGRITIKGIYTEFPISNSASVLSGGPQPGITLGPDGAIWIGDSGNIERLVPPLALACNLPSSLQVGSSLQIGIGCPAFGGASPYVFTISAGTLPPGLTINPSSGAVSGVASGPGPYTFTVTATDGTGETASQVFNVTVAPRTPLVLTCTFPGTAQDTVAYAATCTTTGGTAPYTYSVSAGTLPSGLTLTPTATGVTISGTPTVYGSFSFTVQAVDSGIPQFAATQASTAFAILPPPLTIRCNFSSTAEVNVPFASSCTAAGGIPPYNFSVVGSGAPTWLFAGNPGSFGGTPATAGLLTYAIQVKDSGPPVQTVNTPVTTNVVAAKLGLMCNFSSIGAVGTGYSAACVTTNGVAPYTITLLSGALPPGMTVDNVNSVVSGTPTAAGVFPFTLQVTDTNSPAQTAIQTVSLHIRSVALKITNTSLPDGASGLPYSGNPVVEGGLAPYAWTVSSGTLPAGLVLNPTSGAITGTPTTSGTYTYTLHVADTSTPMQTTTLAITQLISVPVVQDFTEYALPASSGVAGITTGPDGALWFTTLNQTAGNLIGRITTAGAITTFPAPNVLDSAGLPGGITSGPDSTLWFTELGAQRLGQISTDGKLAIDYPVITTTANPQQIVTGPDGALWFTESNASQIGQMSSSGITLNEFPTTTPASLPSGVVVGPDNGIWFTEAATNNIGRTSTDGLTKNEYPIPTAASNPTSITVGPDGALWFAENAASKIGRISATGQITEFATLTPASGPEGITAGADGTLYFTETLVNKIGRITTDGVVSEYTVPTAASGLQGVTLGPDRAIWIAEATANKVARFSFVTQLALTCTFPSATSVAFGSSYSGTCTASQGVAPYTYAVASGTLPPGVALDPATGILSGTTTAPGTFVFTIRATDSSVPVQTATRTAASLTVLPAPLLLTCSLPNTGQTSTPYTGGCTPPGGTAPYAYSISAGTLPAGLTLDPAAGTVSGSPTVPGTFTFTVLVTDASSPVQTAQQSNTIAISLTNGPGGPNTLFTFAGLPLSQPPGTDMTKLQLQLAQTFPVPIQGTVTLSFSNTINGLLPAGYIDPAIQFIDSSGNGLGLTYNFTVPAGSTSITLPAIDPGTVAGNVLLTVTSGGAQTVGSMAVDKLPPIIEAGSVHFANVTATGFDIEFVVTDTTQASSQAVFTFNPASGSVLQGLASFPIDISTLVANWFTTTPGLNNGGVYSLTVPFTHSGPMSAISSVSVTVSNGIGFSQPVSGMP